MRQSSSVSAAEDEATAAAVEATTVAVEATTVAVEAYFRIAGRMSIYSYLYTTKVNTQCPYKHIKL